MKKVLVLILAIFAIACNSTDPKEQLQNLNGYWEIDQVEFSKDSIRDFKMSENIDYFEIKDGKGIRKKVTPQFDGTYKITPKTNRKLKQL